MFNYFKNLLIFIKSINILDAAVKPKGQVPLNGSKPGINPRIQRAI